LAFLVPGFVFSSVRSKFITGQEPQGNEKIVRFLAYSSINYAIFAAPIYLVLAQQPPVFLKALLWAAVVLIGPTITGAISGICVQKDLFRPVFQWLGLNPVHAVPTAWDYKFGRMKGEWLLITLKSGTRFAGYCGSYSFASSDPKERDIFIEAVFNLDGNENWLPTEKSLFVSAGEIATIEFWPLKQETENDKTHESAS
jgi:Family of unknown function (DUF6338)